MPYVTPQALIDRFGEHELLQLTDRATPRNHAVDDAVAELACDRAAAEIDGYVGARYTLPLASTPELLTLLALDVARYHLYELVEPPTVVQNRYNEARRTLEAIRDGKQPLGADLAGAVITATPAALPAFEGGAKDFAPWDVVMASQPWSDDALFVGLRIVQRLKAEMPALAEVVLIDDLADKQAGPRQFPACVVLLDSLQPTGNLPEQQRIPVEQVWLTMLALRSASAAPDRLRTDAGPLIAQCVRALQGWVPEGSQRALSWVRGPRPSYSRDTTYFPLAWRIQLVST